MRPLRELLTMTPRTTRYALGVGAAALAFALGVAGLRLSNAHATPPSPSPAPPASSLPRATPLTPTPPAVAAAEPAPPPSAQITIFTVPPSVAVVTWGKTTLGRSAPGRPLVLVRARDSGPLDIVVRSAGYLPVHSRVHTFADSSVAIKLTKVDEKDTLFGYRAPLDAGAPDEDAQAPPVDVPPPPGVTQPPPPQEPPPAPAPPP